MCSLIVDQKVKSTFLKQETLAFNVFGELSNKFVLALYIFSSVHSMTHDTSP